MKLLRLCQPGMTGKTMFNQMPHDKLGTRVIASLIALQGLLRPADQRLAQEHEALGKGVARLTRPAAFAARVVRACVTGS